MKIRRPFRNAFLYALLPGHHIPENPPYQDNLYPDFILSPIILPVKN